VRSNVEVIVVDGTAAAKACKDATTMIPVVFTLAVDPVADGLAASFARPGGNLTGLTMGTSYDLAGKRLELLKDMVGGLSRVAVLSNPSNPPHARYLRETERVATALGVDVRAFEVRGPNDLPGAPGRLLFRANSVTRTRWVNNMPSVRVTRPSARQSTIAAKAYIPKRNSSQLVDLPLMVRTYPICSDKRPATWTKF
jgi:putative tryptophan/tyrosine transport system substrate-binding protein